MPFNPPFAFYVEGPPVSLQAKNRARLQGWKQTVRAAAEIFWNNRELPTAESLKLQISYFYDQVATGDLDNIIKPIQDSLVGLIYIDDRQITDIACLRRESHLQFVFHTIHDILLDGLTLHDEFLYIVVAAAPNPLIIES